MPVSKNDLHCGRGLHRIHSQQFSFLHEGTPAHLRCRASGRFLLFNSDIAIGVLPDPAVSCAVGAAGGFGFQKKNKKIGLGKWPVVKARQRAGGARSALSTCRASGAVWATGAPPLAAAVHGRGFGAGGQACCPSRSESNLSARIHRSSRRHFSTARRQSLHD